MSRHDPGFLVTLGCAVVTLVSSASTAGAQPIPLPDDYVSSYSGVRSYEVVAGVELAMILTAVAYRDSDMRFHPIRKDTPYYKDVIDHFGPFADHPVFDALGLVPDPEALSGDALRAYTALRNSGYRWRLVGEDLQPLMFLGNWWLGEEYPDPFLAHATLIRDFARESGFADFFVSHGDTYRRLERLYAQRIDIGSVIRWLEDNFQGGYSSYQVVFSPLMRGNQSTTRKTDDDSDFVQVFMLVDPPAEETTPTSTLVAFRWVFTELDHQYVDRALEPYLERIEAIFSKRDHWAAGLQSDNYRTAFRLASEYLTWALYLVYLEEHDSHGSWRAVASSVVPWFEERRGFPRYEAMVEELIRLRAVDDRRMEDLIPALLDWAEADAEGVSWRERAVQDLDFIYHELGDNHPGPVDTLNPWFANWYERGYREARRRAESVTDFAGYFFAIMGYMTGFQDGHLGALSEDRLRAPLERRWPGFLLRYDQGEFRAVLGSRGASAPDLPREGATLVSCDGIPASAMADSVLLRFVGLWSVNGVRPRLAPWLLVDEGNPWVSRPERCLFSDGDSQREVALSWVPVSSEELGVSMEAAVASFVPPIQIRRFQSGGWWISLSSFNSGDQAVVAAIDSVVAIMERQRQELLEAEVVVFDVRGNTGGNSANGSRVAAALWGPEMIDALPQRSLGVDWRVSPGNLAFLRRSTLPVIERQFGNESSLARRYRELIWNMEGAIDLGVDLLEDRSLPRAPRVLPANPVGGTVFLLTDPRCASACLDFADLMLALPGVVHVGLETSADAVYIDNRAVDLPSGQGRLGFSMKVYRGRVRGHNVSYVPAHAWGGSMADTQALERWVMELADAGTSR